MNYKKLTDSATVPSIMDFVREYTLSPQDVLNELDQYLNSDQCADFIQHLRNIWDIE